MTSQAANDPETPSAKQAGVADATQGRSSIGKNWFVLALLGALAILGVSLGLALGLGSSAGSDDTYPEADLCESNVVLNLTNFLSPNICETELAACPERVMEECRLLVETIVGEGPASDDVQCTDPPNEVVALRAMQLLQVENVTSCADVLSQGHCLLFRDLMVVSESCCATCSSPTARRLLQEETQATPEESQANQQRQSAPARRLEYVNGAAMCDDMPASVREACQNAEHRGNELNCRSASQAHLGCMADFECDFLDMCRMACLWYEQQRAAAEAEAVADDFWAGPVGNWLIIGGTVIAGAASGGAIPAVAAAVGATTAATTAATVATAVVSTAAVVGGTGIAGFVSPPEGVDEDWASAAAMNMRLTRNLAQCVREMNEATNERIDDLIRAIHENAWRQNYERARLCLDSLAYDWRRNPRTSLVTALDVRCNPLSGRSEGARLFFDGRSSAASTSNWRRVFVDQRYDFVKNEAPAMSHSPVDSAGYPVPLYDVAYAQYKMNAHAVMLAGEQSIIGFYITLLREMLVDCYRGRKVDCGSGPNSARKTLEDHWEVARAHARARHPAGGTEGGYNVFQIMDENLAQYNGAAAEYALSATHALLLDCNHTRGDGATQQGCSLVKATCNLPHPVPLCIASDLPAPEGGLAVAAGDQVYQSPGASCSLPANRHAGAPSRALRTASRFTEMIVSRPEYRWGTWQGNVIDPVFPSNWNDWFDRFGATTAQRDRVRPASEDLAALPAQTGTPMLGADAFTLFGLADRSLLEHHVQDGARGGPFGGVPCACCTLRSCVL